MQSNNLEDKAAGRDRKEIRHLLQTFLDFQIPWAFNCYKDKTAKEKR